MKTNTNLKKVNTIFKATLLLLFVFNTVATMGQSGSCNADLRVDKDWNVRSTPADGTYYAMVITNKGKASDTYSLSTLNVNGNCTNPDNSATAKNVILKVEFLDKNQKPISEIKVSPGETIPFFAHIVVPRGTAVNKWSCLEVVAKSRICSNYKVDTVLHTLVINSDEDK